MATARATQRSGRNRNAVPSVAIAGYTNAGKSSLLNRLTGAGVLVQDALFATLDPTVRRAETDEGREYTLTDTVGFVRHLPHQLVDAFRSTLTCWCPTRAATWWPGCTATERCSARRTRVAAPGCPHGWTAHWRRPLS